MSMRTVLMVILLFMVVMIGGCVEEQKAQPVWGKGELPAEHQGFFGNDNTARLDYVQNRVLDKHAAILKIIAIRVLALEAVDPNATAVESRVDVLETQVVVLKERGEAMARLTNITHYDENGKMIGGWDPNAITVETRLDLLEAALIREAQGFRGASPIEGMVRWDEDGTERLEIYSEGGWVFIMSRNEMLSDSEMVLLPMVEAVKIDFSPGEPSITIDGRDPWDTMGLAK